jgi:hypothetical protein
MLRILDARNPDDRKTIAAIGHIGSSMSEPDIEEGLRLLCDFLHPAWLGLRAGAFSLEVRRGFGVVLVPELAANIGFRLQVLSGRRGFERLLVKLREKKKTWDILFEAEAAEWCIQFGTVTDVEFERHYQAAGVADFTIWADNREFACECKNVEHGQLSAYRQMTDIAVARGDVDEALQKVYLAVGEKFAEGLKEAKRQLPCAYPCGLFVRCLVAEDAPLESLYRRMRRDGYENFEFVCVMSGRRTRVIARDATTIANLFPGTEVIVLPLPSG